MRGKAVRVESAAELLGVFAMFDPYHQPALIQAFIAGPNASHMKVCAYVDAQGSAVACVCMRKIRQYPTEYVLMQGTLACATS